jgi:putative transposase
MDDYESLSHSKWECKYHVVFIPKCRRKTLYLELRRHLGDVFRKLAEQKESRIEEGHLLLDHVHMLISIPPKHAVSQVIGFIKGKSAIHLARVYGEKKRNFVGQHFWARGYFVSTVGRDTEVIREYIKKQEEEDKRLEQMNLWRWWATFRWPTRSGAASAAPSAALSGSQPKAPGFAGGYLLAWCVGNAKVEPRGNAVLITKQASGSGKIDPLMAALNCVHLMSLNPQVSIIVQLRHAILARGGFA